MSYLLDTNNDSDLLRVEGIKLENWLRVES